MSEIAQTGMTMKKALESYGYSPVAKDTEPSQVDIAVELMDSSAVDYDVRILVDYREDRPVLSVRDARKDLQSEVFLDELDMEDVYDFSASDWQEMIAEDGLFGSKPRNLAVRVLDDSGVDWAFVEVDRQGNAYIDSDQRYREDEVSFAEEMMMNDENRGSSRGPGHLKKWEDKDFRRMMERKFTPRKGKIESHPVHDSYGNIVKDRYGNEVWIAEHSDVVRRKRNDVRPEQVGQSPIKDRKERRSDWEDRYSNRRGIRDRDSVKDEKKRLDLDRERSFAVDLEHQMTEDLPEYSRKVGKKRKKPLWTPDIVDRHAGVDASGWEAIRWEDDLGDDVNMSGQRSFSPGAPEFVDSQPENSKNGNQESTLEARVVLLRERTEIRDELMDTNTKKDRREFLRLKLELNQKRLDKITPPVSKVKERVNGRRENGHAADVARANVIRRKSALRRNGARMTNSFPG